MFGGTANSIVPFLIICIVNLIQAKQPLDTSRAVYVPTSKLKRICKGSWISEETHIQICVRNSNNILAVWHVREDGRYGKEAN